MSKTFKYTVLVVLDGCSHTPEYDWQYRPLEGDAIYCYKCASVRTYVRYMDQYRVQCDDCRFTRNKGTAKLNAEIEASKHHLKNPDHMVKLFLGRQVVHIWKRSAENRDQTVIDFPLDDVPF